MNHFFLPSINIVPFTRGNTMLRVFQKNIGMTECYFTPKNSKKRQRMIAIGSQELTETTGNKMIR